MSVKTALFIVGLVAAYLIYGSIPWIIDKFNLVHASTTECVNPLEGSAHCVQFYADDGHIQKSSFTSEHPHCCIVRRHNLTNKYIGNETLRVCDLHSSRPVQCSQSWFTSSPDTYVFGDRSLVVDYAWEKSETTTVILPDHSCAKPPEGSASCYDAHTSAGPVQYALFPTEPQNCCILSRLTHQHPQASFTTRVCDFSDETKTFCNKVGFYGYDTPMVNGRRLLPDPAFSTMFVGSK